MLKLLKSDRKKVKIAYNKSNTKKYTTKPFLRTNIFVCRNVRLNLVRASRCVCACELVYARQDVRKNTYANKNATIYNTYIYMYEL